MIGANPNKTAGLGKTCLGEAANIGNISILKLLIDATKTGASTAKPSGSYRKRHTKSHKRKLRNYENNDETIVKCKNLNERTFKDFYVNQCSVEVTEENVSSEKNQGYFVFIHSEGSSSDESKISSLKSPLSPSTMSPSPHAELEWDEEIGDVAPTTIEDETWSSMYRWYAAILECTGAAIAAASVVTNGIDQQDAFMRTALHYASDKGHEGAVQLLLDSGCKVDVTAGDGLTPLHVAVIRNHIGIVKILLAAGSHVNYKTHEKMTSLHFAASRGYLELVKILVNNGAHLEARDTNERTALYLAAGRGHTEVVKYLITSGANVNGEEIHGYTPLCEAVWQRYAEVVDVMLSSGARITHSHKLLHNAIIQRQEGIVKMLANVGGGINLHNDNGDTPLLLAARLSQPKVARILLEKGANVNACNSITGASALHLAVESIDCPKEFEELLVCLLEYKIDTNATALTGDTALNRALLLHKDHAAVLLIRHGADVNACDLHSCGLDNLSIASRRQTSDLASMLIKAGHCTTIPDYAAIIPKPGTTTNWLYHVSKNPLELADLCRIKIRSVCRNKTMHSYIALLPLPKSLKMFLMMDGEGIY
ncbi:serine/threonine-protein phosphatase 6 regulatory ankyrin repeat subunit C isoform X2 [Amyelois transitella]|uniref:serine/threonine-protein phosphatase 6 regulatory ankyrin repeat subunit C isoform X2 n=1 Tax=Amyelois transitella TaxID=680683 RepID=UPI00299041B2|nr:serine/threonine-protein phosphatase 6 regulatory ankyrin repeat subunit C isoform X2 [Amyelois transitella]